MNFPKGEKRIFDATQNLTRASKIFFPLLENSYLFCFLIFKQFYSSMNLFKGCFKEPVFFKINTYLNQTMRGLRVQLSKYVFTFKFSKGQVFFVLSRSHLVTFPVFFLTVFHLWGRSSKVEVGSTFSLISLFAVVGVVVGLFTNVTSLIKKNYKKDKNDNLTINMMANG